MGSDENLNMLSKLLDVVTDILTVTVFLWPSKSTSFPVVQYIVILNNFAIYGPF